jgi:uncharacterized repeat protein (TIGR03809 family)
MTGRTELANGRQIVARWCNLAEQRLEYLTELFETGRWRRYYSELAFLENIREAKVTVEIWRELLRREASADNSAIDMSWLGRGRPALPRGEVLRDPAARLQSQRKELSAAQPRRVASFAVAEDVMLDPVPSAAGAPALGNMPLSTLDPAVMQERYPLLRNAP